MQRKAGTPQLMKAMNRAMIIDLLAKEGPISQTEISEITGLSRATVSVIVNELKQERLIAEASKQASRSGRRQILLELDANSGFVVGIDLSCAMMAGAVTDLKGKPRVKLRWPSRAEAGPEAVLETLIDFLGTLREKAGVSPSRIRGVGIGVPGIVKPGGVVQWAPFLGWRDLDLAARLYAELSIPVFIENDVNLLALGEYWYGVGQGMRSLVCLAAGTGVGAGIVLDGQLYTGVHQAAGEVCNLVVDRSHLAQDFSHFGCLEMLASGPALAKQFFAMREGEDRGGRDGGAAASSRDMAMKTSSNLTGAEVVFEEARRGNRLARQIIEEFTQHLAISIIALTTILDPDMIVLGGGLSREADLFRDRLLELCAPVVHVMPRLEVSTLGTDAAVLGAVAHTLYLTKEDPWRQSDQA